MDIDTVQCLESKINNFYSLCGVCRCDFRSGTTSGGLRPSNCVRFSDSVAVCILKQKNEKSRGDQRQQLPCKWSSSDRRRAQMTNGNSLKILSNCHSKLTVGKITIRKQLQKLICFLRSLIMQKSRQTEDPLIDLNYSNWKSASHRVSLIMSEFCSSRGSRH